MQLLIFPVLILLVLSPIGGGNAQIFRPRATLTADKNTTDITGKIKLTCTDTETEDTDVKYTWYLDNWSRKDLGTRNVSTLLYKHVMNKRVDVSCLVTDVDGYLITRRAESVIIRFTGSSAVSIGSGVILPVLLFVTSYMLVW